MINQTDIQMLSRFIELPVKPERVTFDVRTLGTEGGIGPTDSEVFAVLEYSSSNYAQVLKILKASDQSWQSGDFQLRPSDWFDVNQLPDGGDLEKPVTIRTDKLQSATAFFSSPYLNGVVIPLKRANTILVVLFTTWVFAH